MSLVAVDFETEGIQHRPEYPPKPVGVAIQRGTTRKYLAWGHPSENNCTRAEAIRELKQAWKEIPVFHNAAFDIEVAMEHLGLPFPKRFEDSMILAFLHDPRDQDLSLKGLADAYLDMPPDEQTKLREWIEDNVEIEKGQRWGAYIALAPGRLVGKYAKGDVIRTMRLFKLFHKYVCATGMDSWYEKEKALIRSKFAMEQGGIRTDIKKLKRDVPKWQQAWDDVRKSIRRRLKISKRWESENCKDGVFNVGSSAQLADAMDHAGVVNEWIYTEKGNRSTKRENLEAVCEDKKLVELLAMDSVLKNYVNTFLTRWLEEGAQNDGYIYPTFNFVRNRDEDGKSTGTRTGRLSSSNPNFQNIPAGVEASQHAELLIKLQRMLRQKYKLEFIGLRDYFIPDEGCCFIGRDYSQQELRILAHYEDGAFLQMYHDDPTMDAHTAIQMLVAEATGITFPRKHIKITNFGILYGMGLAKLAARIGVDSQTARQVKNGILTGVPGIKELNKELKKMANRDEPMYTWGGREYYCEEEKMVAGSLRTFEYKQLNYLIQGSAADCTKVGMLNTQTALNDSRVVLQVHDELLACAPIGSWKREMKLLKEAMEDVSFDLPMLSDGEQGKTSWARMKKVKD